MIDRTEPLIEQLLQAACDHGTDQGSDVEAGDLQEMLRAAWALLTPEQRQEFFERPEITTLMETPEYGDIDTTRPGQEDRDDPRERPEACRRRAQRAAAPGPGGPAPEKRAAEERRTAMSETKPALAPEMVRDYIAGHGTKCPFCGSSEIESGRLDCEGPCAWAPVTCSVCGQQWQDVFSLADIDLIDEDGAMATIMPVSQAKTEHH